MRFAAFIVLTLAALGCKGLESPAGYVPVEGRGGRTLLAVSSEDCRFSVRSIANPGEGDLDFWAEAVKNQLVRKRGYTHLATRPLETDAGRKGVELEFTTTGRGITYLYLVTLFREKGLFHDNLEVVEAAGERSVLAEDRAAIRAAVKKL